MDVRSHSQHKHLSEDSPRCSDKTFNLKMTTYWKLLVGASSYKACHSGSLNSAPHYHRQLHNMIYKFASIVQLIKVIQFGLFSSIYPISLWVIMLVSVKLSLGKSSQICIIISHHISASIVIILLINKFRWGMWRLLVYNFDEGVMFLI